MALTAKQIASIIGVSQATLSLVVNNKPGLSEQTRNRVLTELKTRGFAYLLNEKPNDELLISDSKTIGFIIYRADRKLLGYDSFFPLIIDGIESCAWHNGYNISFIIIDKNGVNEGIRRIKEANCCGIVIFATEMKEDDLPAFIESKLPFVLLDNHFNGYNINTVEVGNEQGTYRAVRYLYEIGHRKIGYLKSGVDINSFHDRYMYAIQAMKQFGIENPEKYVLEIGYPSENAYEGMLKLLKTDLDLPTAFLADNDLVVAGAMKACKERGYGIPEDISFVGFDDRPVCFLTEPPMTTIAIPRDAFGSEAVKLLLRVIDGDQTHMRISICGNLVKRDSVSAV